MSDRHLGALRVLACASRTRIYQLLQNDGGAMPVEDVALGVGLHVNTAREHLDRLVASGFIEREAEHRTTRGRPRILYRSVGSAAVAAVDARAREQLVRLLLDGYGKAMESPGRAAEEAGEAWAGELGCPGASSSDDDAADLEDQLGALRRHFEDLGFEPEFDMDTLELHLRHCPFEDVARDRRDVVCGAHAGLARGVLTRHEGPLSVDRLEPLVESQHCVLHLTRADLVDEAELAAVESHETATALA